MKALTLTSRLAIAAAGAVLLAGCELPRPATEQVGYRGTGMVQVDNTSVVKKQAAANVVPESLPRVEPAGPLAGEIYQNVQVLGDLTVPEFTRVMQAMTNWVSPEQGCQYCHEGANLASDAVYQKSVARSMLVMTRHLNSEWGNHVGDTGVTCYTCHRGNNVPANTWSKDPKLDKVRGLANRDTGQNHPSQLVAYSSLPADPFGTFLENENAIRVIGTKALPHGNTSTIKGAEKTYGLMMHLSDSLGVNCTFCHNTRSMAQWDQSSPQRTKAFYGIRMVRDINVNHVLPTGQYLPTTRLGPAGDVPKVNCTTCHQGVNKPLLGVSMFKDYPELGAARSQPDVVIELGADGRSANVYFAVGKSVVTTDAMQVLAPLVEYLRGNPGTKVVLSGFHDPTGDRDANIELAKNRAYSVRDTLVASGIAEDRFSLVKPAETTGSGNLREARRVEIATQL
jgi:photosynthetic reaction center cytochrome c subunit